MTTGIFPLGGAAPEEVGLPAVPDNLNGTCEAGYYGGGCSQMTDINALNKLIATLAYVAYKKGKTPACGNDEVSLAWLYDCIEEIACDSTLTVDEVDPSTTSTTTTAPITTTLADGSTQVCTTTTTTEVCPKIHYNKSDQIIWFYDEAVGQWIPYTPDITLLQEGTGAPGAATAVQPPFYCDTATSDFYAYANSAWKQVGGSQNLLQIGSGAPGAATPTSPPYYCDVDTTDFYVYANGAWKQVGASGGELYPVGAQYIGWTTDDNTGGSSQTPTLANDGQVLPGGTQFLGAVNFGPQPVEFTLPGDATYSWTVQDRTGTNNINWYHFVRTA